MNAKLKGNLLVLTAAVIWGCIGLYSRELGKYNCSPFEITYFRASISMVLIFLFLVIFKRDLLKIKLKHIPIFLGSGVASYLFFNFCHMTSLTMNSMAVAALLLYTSPVWVTIISAFVFKDKITVQKIIALVLAVGGCALVSFQGTAAMTSEGLFYGILSGFGYALYSIFGRIGVKYYSSITVTFYTFLFATIFGTPLLFILPNSNPIEHLTTIEPVILLACVALTNTLLTYTLYTAGLKYISSSNASIISIIEPIVAVFVGLIFFNETLNLLGALGIIAVVVGLVFLEIPLKKKNEKV